MDRNRRNLVGGASAIALLAGSVAAIAQQQESTGAEKTEHAASGMVKPTSRGELQSLLQSAADTQTVVVLDPATDITVDKTIEVVQRKATSRMWGVIGNGAKIRSAIRNRTPVVKYSVIASDHQEWTSSRGLTIQTLDIIGSLEDGPGLMLHAPTSRGAFYRAILRDNATSSSNGLGALHIKGAVFELMIAGHASENNRQHGVAVEHDGRAIASNVMFHGLNSSRNTMAGLYTSSNSVDVVQGSFVNNGDSGINAPAGIRSVAFINGENTGQFVIRVGGFANIHNCEASTDGKTIQHDGVTGKAAGVPTEALIDYNGFNQYSNDLKLTGECKVTTYAGGTGYLARIRQTQGTSNVWLEPWMDRSLIRRARNGDKLPLIRQVTAT
ncbi:MAG: hypothetical protein JSR91_06125 [Proteobacteria bacterium]|nr:hypothetical protein [Pseudomonadota bacterium]